MKEFNLEEVLLKLKDEREIFSSEADFQLALAWKIKEEYCDVEVRCEYPIELNKNYIHLDILVIWEKKWIPIELKYKTATLEYKDVKGIEYCLKHQGAKDIGCYDYLKDIQRIERIKNSKTGKVLFEKGYTIFLTNDLSYCEPPKKAKAYYRYFSIDDKRKIPKYTFWDQAASKGTKRGREKGITLKENYTCDWKTYSYFKENAIEFKYILHEIK